MSDFLNSIRKQLAKMAQANEFRSPIYNVMDVMRNLPPAEMKLPEQTEWESLDLPTKIKYILQKQMAPEAYAETQKQLKKKKPNLAKEAPQ